MSVAAAGSRSGEIFSHSRLAAFESCPRKFQYRYVWKLPPESESIEGFVGKRVHEVLERLYRAAGTGNLPSLPAVLARYRQLFDDAHDPAHVRIAREGTPPEFYRELGERCLANYYLSHYPFDREETLALEERVELDLGRDGDESRYRLQGFVDRIARAPDGALEIHDYKTSARLPSQAEIDEDRQLALYQMGIGARYGAGRPVRLVWHYLRHTRTLVSTRSQDDLCSLREATRERIDRIRAERIFAPKPSPLCRWCEYRQGCPASPERPADRPVYTPPAARPPRRPAPAPHAAPGQLAFAFARP